MDIVKFKELLLLKYDKLIELGLEIEYPSEENIIMLFYTQMVFAEYEIEQYKRLKRQV